VEESFQFCQPAGRSWIIHVGLVVRGPTPGTWTTYKPTWIMSKLSRSRPRFVRESWCPLTSCLSAATIAVAPGVSAAHSISRAPVSADIVVKLDRRAGFNEFQNRRTVMQPTRRTIHVQVLCSKCQSRTGCTYENGAIDVRERRELWQYFDDILQWIGGYCYNYWQRRHNLSIYGLTSWHANCCKVAYDSLRALPGHWPAVTSHLRWRAKR